MIEAPWFGREHEELRIVSDDRRWHVVESNMVGMKVSNYKKEKS